MDNDRSNDSADGRLIRPNSLDPTTLSLPSTLTSRVCTDTAVDTPARWSSRASAMSASRTSASAASMGGSGLSSPSSSSSSLGGGGTKEPVMDALATFEVSPTTIASLSDGVRDARRLARLARRLAASSNNSPVAAAASAAAAAAISARSRAAFAALTSAGLALNLLTGLIGDAGCISVRERESRVTDDDAARDDLADDGGGGFVGDSSDGDGSSPGGPESAPGCAPSPGPTSSPSPPSAAWYVRAWSRR